MWEYSSFLSRILAGLRSGASGEVEAWYIEYICAIPHSLGARSSTISWLLVIFFTLQTTEDSMKVALWRFTWQESKQTSQPQTSMAMSSGKRSLYLGFWGKQNGHQAYDFSSAWRPLAQGTLFSIRTESSSPGFWATATPWDAWLVPILPQGEPTASHPIC